MATNEEMLLAALTNGTTITEFQPQNNRQAYLANLCGAGNPLPSPRTVEEALLYNLCAKGISGGGLPSGFAMGEFVTTLETMYGEFWIEHGLGAIPNIIIIYCEEAELSTYKVMGVCRFNYGEDFDTELEIYCPVNSNGSMFNCNGSTTDPGVVKANDNGTFMDTREAIYVPKGGNYVKYATGVPYKWLAIRLEA